MTDNRVQRRTGLLGKKIYLEVDGELRVGGRLHFSLLPSEPYKNKNYD